MEKQKKRNIINRIRDYFYNRRLNRLEDDLKVLNQRIAFNPYNVARLSEEVDNSLKLSNRIEEYRVWYIGKEQLLRELYAKHLKPQNLNYFWHKAPPDYRLIHSGIPGLISRKMAGIIFGSGYKLDITKYNEIGEKDEKASEEVKALLEGVIDATNLNEKLKQAAETESWSGNVFFKLSHDVDISDYPILEICDIRNAEEIKIRGITVAIVFKYYYETKKNKYRLDETYTTNQDGDAVIRYQLVKLITEAGKSAREVEAQLEEVEELKELAMKLNDSNEIVYNGIKGMLAVAKPNKLPSHEFMDIAIGASDYEGAIGSFDALDEVYSEMIAEVRNNKVIRYIPTEMLPKYYDESIGKFITQKPNPFITNYQEVTLDADQGTKKEITIKEIPDKADSLKSKFTTALTTAINQAGLSPYALGITGLEGVNTSAESQQERNKVTLETRSSKQQIWMVFMEKLFIKMLELNAWMRKELKVIQPFESNNEISYSNLDISIEFNPYIYPRPEDLLTTWGLAKQQRVASTREAISNIHPEWSDVRVQEEVNLIRYEEGMTLDTPELMQFEKVLDTQEEEKDNE